MISIKERLIQPRRIRLEAATPCQLKCPACPTAAGATGKRLGAGFLKFDDFKRIVDNNPWVSSIELSNWGEIFLNKDLLKIIKYAYRHNVAISAANGANLNDVTEEVLEALAKYRFRKITCSIDGASQETYSIYRVKGNFNRVIDNIKTINKFKAKYHSRYPLLKWQYIAFGHNEHEISKARKMAEDLNMEFYVKLSWEDLYTMAFSPVKNAELVRKETGLGVADRSEYREVFGMDYVSKSCCAQMFRTPQVNYDGKVLGCSVNYWDDYGNAFNEGLKEGMNNDKINYARDMVMGKREAKKGVPCTTCKIYKKMKQHNDWLSDEDVEDIYTESRLFIMLENKILGLEPTRQLASLWGKAKRRVTGERLGIERVKRKRKKPTDHLKSGIYPLTIPLAPDNERGWKPYPIFKGVTAGSVNLSCHVSVLNHNHCPHAPHIHNEEELLLLLSGEVDLILPTEDADGNQRMPLKENEFVYYPTPFSHTLKTMSKSPANYLMFKWSAQPEKKDSQLGFSRFNMFGEGTGKVIKEGFHPRLIFQGPTTCLNKLRCHTSTLTPGAGYEPHVDEYDVAIIVLDGEVETLGQRAGPHSVIFYAAGEPHGMHNPGKNTAKYIVFEFHS